MFAPRFDGGFGFTDGGLDFPLGVFALLFGHPTRGAQTGLVEGDGMDKDLVVLCPSTVTTQPERWRLPPPFRRLM